jgi:hypothetical protein
MIKSESETSKLQLSLQHLFLNMNSLIYYQSILEKDNIIDKFDLVYNDLILY